MSNSIYPKLAFSNIKNNKKTYLPYVLTAILTVMMFYMLDALSKNESVGEGSLHQVLASAVVVCIVFAVIFLFYTNSFLIKRRKKEIGVYHVLGMGKGHIAKMLAIETAFIAFVSIIGGLVCGMIFGKLSYLILLKMLHYDVQMSFAISLQAVADTLLLFIVIFALTLIYNLFQIRLSNSVELLHGGSQGEREPKTKWVLTIVGLICIGSGYYIAVTTESPIAAIGAFFGAVILVIIGTYALFAAGSIALLKLLRKNKNYYYKTKHFTSVSGMIYRMKQNAVGLSNICILSTMVLVMVSTSVALYAGMNDILETRFPNEYEINDFNNSGESQVIIDTILQEETNRAGVTIKTRLEYRYGSMGALKTGGKMELEEPEDYSAKDVCELTIIPVQEYNRLEQKDIILAEDEVIIYTAQEGKNYGRKSIQIGSRTFDVVQELDDFILKAKTRSNVMAEYYVIVSDEAVAGEILKESYGEDAGQEDGTSVPIIRSRIRLDFAGEQAQRLQAMEEITKRIEAETAQAFGEGREMNREPLYMLYGGLLFIGMYLGGLFLMATTLIIYYKQISEGFDDKDRYQIMQKVGMSKREVRQSIRSQVLTVFFLPLLVAVLHTAVAFPVVTKLLSMLNLVNVPLFFRCTVCVIIIFAAFYAVIFAATAKQYYKIVN